MRYAIGMVHGRFQPLHKEHLQYVLTAFRRCSQLIIGITNPEPTEFTLEPLSPHRHQEEANPFTYFQRTEMIRECLADEQIDQTRISVVPFHIFHPEKWEYYLPSPRIVIQYVRVFSAWEDRKIEMFRQHGFCVEILDRNAPKNIEGVGVRKRMAVGEDWRALVPLGSARVIDRIAGGEL